MQSIIEQDVDMWRTTVYFEQRNSTMYIWSI